MKSWKYINILRGGTEREWGGNVGHKTLKAIKCKDGWMVEITDTEFVWTYTDVKVRVRQAGMEIKQDGEVEVDYKGTMGNRRILAE